MKSYVQFFLLQVLFVTWTLAASNTTYCDACKGTVIHTVCARPGCPAIGLCRIYKQTPLTSAEKQLIVQKHNELRNKVATGQSGLPAAANMNKLKWNEELAYIAQCWANACFFEHDRCRDTHSTQVGQNIGSRESTIENNIRSLDAYSKIIQNWYKEIKSFNDPIDKYRPNFDTGHFTQVVWADTTDIGCGKVLFKDSIFWTLRLFFNYGTGGNIFGQSIYKEGGACSQCQNNEKCDQDFTGLCS